VRDQRERFFQAGVPGPPCLNRRRNSCGGSPLPIFFCSGARRVEAFTTRCT